jgi:hypothetical protein
MVECMDVSVFIKCVKIFFVGKKSHRQTLKGGTGLLPLEV